MYCCSYTQVVSLIYRLLIYFWMPWFFNCDMCTVLLLLMWLPFHASSNTALEEVVFVNPDLHGGLSGSMWSFGCGLWSLLVTCISSSMLFVFVVFIGATEAPRICAIISSERTSPYPHNIFSVSFCSSSWILSISSWVSNDRASSKSKHHLSSLSFARWPIQAFDQYPSHSSLILAEKVFLLLWKTMVSHQSVCWIVLLK